MYKLIKIEYNNPISKSRANPVEYVITRDNRLFFGPYSKVMTKFYNESIDRTLIAESKDYTNILSLFMQCYWPILNEEYETLLRKNYPKDSEQTTLNKIRKYNASRYYYCKVPYSHHIKPFRSAFLQFVKYELLPNDNEVIYEVRDFIEDLVDNIADEILVYEQSLRKVA